MKLLIVLALMCCSAMAAPAHPQRVAVVQDSIGNYLLNVNLANQQKMEERNAADGSVHGSYGYFDPYGIYKTLEYVSGPQGFMVVGGNLEPKPVTDTPEVSAAKAQLAAAYRAAV